MDGFLLDLRGAWRAGRRQPQLTALIILTLVLGIGANAAIFAVARGTLLRPLPYTDPESLVMLWRTAANAVEPRGIATPEMLREYRRRSQSFVDIAAVELWTGNPSSQVDLAGPDGVERLRGSVATPNLFAVVGVEAALGRTFDDRDDRHVVVLSHALWQRRFGADAGIVGQTLELVGGRNRARTRYEVVGVLPPRFRFTYPDDTELWLPAPWADVSAQTPQALMYNLVGRLKPGVNREAATADMAVVGAAMHADVPGRGYDRMRLWVEPIHEWSVGRVRPALRLILAVTGLLLVIACLNVASLLLAQTAPRRRELALQRSLGATRGRLARQMITEAGVLTLFATIAAVGLVAVLQPGLRALLPPGIPRADEVGLDPWTVAWATAMGAATLALAGWLPCWRGTRVDAHAELAIGGRSYGVSRGGPRIRQALTAVQIAAASLLLICGGLLLSSLWNLRSVNLGFDAAAVLTQELRLMGPAYRDTDRQRAFADALLRRVRQIPGVRAAATTNAIPLRGTDLRRQYPVPGSDERLVANERYVDPAYFEVMRIALLEGRTITDADADGAPVVALVSESFARAMFQGRSALGERLPTQRLDPGPPPRVVTESMEIVGVVGDVRSVRLEEPGGPAVYVSRQQRTFPAVSLVIRADPGAAHMAPAVRSAIREVDPAQPAAPMTTIDEVVGGTIADRRLVAVATSAFAVLALVLTIAGLYGVMVIGTTERLRELGIRVALGATRRALVSMLLRQGIGPVIVGLVLGSIAAVWVTRVLASYLFGVQSIAPELYAGVGLVVVCAGIAACLFPARMAARVDPMRALRSE